MCGEMKCHIFVCILALLTEISCKCFNDVRLKIIPSNHIYYQLIKKTKNGLVIGHMGNIFQYQENTLEGMKNLVAIKADGMHMKVQLTKDDQLILFGDDNLYRMTGEDFEVSKLPYSEIKKMNLQTSISYGRDSEDREIERTYTSTLKIPLLRDVLNAVRGKNMLIYIELIPGNVPPIGPFDRHRSYTTAKYVAKLIQEMQLENDVIVVSKDAFKLKALNHFSQNIVLGWLIDELYFVGKQPEKIKSQYNDLFAPDENCFDSAPSSFSFTKYLVTSAIISKAVNASLADLSVNVLSDPKYFSSSNGDTFKNVLKSSYGNKITLGVFQVFPIGSSKQTKKEDITFINNALASGVTRFVTDDVNRVKLALHESVTTYSTGSILSSYFTVFILTVLFGKALVTIIFV